MYVVAFTSCLSKMINLFKTYKIQVLWATKIANNHLLYGNKLVLPCRFGRVLK